MVHACFLIKVQLAIKDTMENYMKRYSEDFVAQQLWDDYQYRVSLWGNKGLHLSYKVN